MAISWEANPPPGVVGSPYLYQPAVNGGSLPYHWETVDSTMPDGLGLDQQNGSIYGKPETAGTSHFTIRVTDAANDSVLQNFALVVSPAEPSSLRSRLWESVGHTSFWLAFLAVSAPLVGTVWIVVYSFSTPGAHWTYLGVGMLTSLAAFAVGCFVGFLFGIPRVVSSGQLRQAQSSSAAGMTAQAAPSTNLAEVSDWLTKLVLGAGLVQLTHLGGPIGDLIDHVAAGLHAAGAAAPVDEAATVMAGVILFGYSVIGMLDGYIVTTIWYQKKLQNSV